MKQFTVEVGPEQSNGGTIRRAAISPDQLIRYPDPNVLTLYDVLENSKEKFGDKQAFGFRKVEQVIEEEKEIIKIVNGEEQKTKKTWKFFQMSGYHYLSYNSASRLAHELGAGFVHLGLSPKAKVEIFAPTK